MKLSIGTTVVQISVSVFFTMVVTAKVNMRYSGACMVTCMTTTNVRRMPPTLAARCAMSESEENLLTPVKSKCRTPQNTLWCRPPVKL